MICSESHETKGCPSIPGLKVVFQEETIPNSIEYLCFVTRRPWLGTQNQGFNNQMYLQPPPNWNSWQQPWPQPQPQPQSQLWAQGVKIFMGDFLNIINILHLIRIILPHIVNNKTSSHNFKIITLDFRFHFHNNLHNKTKISNSYYCFSRNQISYLPNHYQTPTIKTLIMLTW